MTKAYYLGVDVGGTKTHALIASAEGEVAGFGEGGPGNHEGLGYGGLEKALTTSIDQALEMAGISPKDLVGGGFGIAGYDWPSERENNVKVIQSLGLDISFDLVNDTILGLLAGARQGWGVAVVSGTGCNCWGWDRTRQHIGRVTGNGEQMGEAAGATEIIDRAIRAVSYQWVKRGPATALADAFIRFTGASSLENLIEGLSVRQYTIDDSAAPLVFKVAEAGDEVAIDVTRWASFELSELVKCVIRQLNLQDLDFDIVLIGSMFENGRLLIEPMREQIAAYAPHARLVKLTVPPVVGAVCLGVEATGQAVSETFRVRLNNSMARLRGMKKDSTEISLAGR
jgi:N-acetylglucosamine kinase-like BadF-type ATPase